MAILFSTDYLSTSYINKKLSVCHLVCGGRRYFVSRAFNHEIKILISDKNDGSLVVLYKLNGFLYTEFYKKFIDSCLIRSVPHKMPHFLSRNNRKTSIQNDLIPNLERGFTY